MKIKNRILLYPLVIMALILIFAYGCKKDELPANAVKDIDGNIYHTVTIGTQTWLVENLKVTKYRDGTPIQNITDAIEWGSLTTGAYCDYDNLLTNSTIYGKLYNWFVVNDSRNIAPTGWHVPTDSEWAILTDYLGGDSLAGGKLKEKGIIHWQSPNTGATNETGFTALPSGARDYGGLFSCIGINGVWWSSTESNSLEASMWIIAYAGSYMGRYNNNKVEGYSIRCLKD